MSASHAAALVLLLLSLVLVEGLLALAPDSFVVALCHAVAGLHSRVALAAAAVAAAAERLAGLGNQSAVAAATATTTATAPAPGGSGGCYTLGLPRLGKAMQRGAA